MIPLKTYALATAAAALVAGCAMNPPANEALDEARAAYRAAQSDPHVSALAPDELDAAGRSLNQADALWREGADPQRVAHQAYLAAQTARIAREVAMKRAAEEEIENQELREARQVRDEALSKLSAVEAAREAARETARNGQARELAEAEQLSAEVRRLEAQVAALDARQTDRGWVLSLGNEVLFDVGEATLKPGGRRAIDQLARFLRAHPERDVLIEGFTDASGSDELNRRLSERRARAVQDALVRSGVSSRRLETRGLGEAFPVASNDTAAGRQLNRRVEIVLAEGEGRAATGGAR